MTAPIRSMPGFVAKSDAKAFGLLRYFTGKACRHGHVAERHVSTGICLDCGRLHRVANYRKDIEKSRAKERGRIAKNPQANRDRVRAWRKANPTKKRAAAKRHYERRRDQKKAYRIANCERARAYFRARYLANKDLYKVYSRNRKALRRNAEGKHSTSDIAAIRKAQRNRCAYCRLRLVDGQWHVDHIIALSRGGTNWPANLQITCAPCNLSKGTADPVQFAQRIGMLL